MDTGILEHRKVDLQAIEDYVLEQRLDALVGGDIREGWTAWGASVAASPGIAAAPNPNTFQHPLGPPTVSGTTYTVDFMLNAPSRINRMVMDLTLQRFFADRVFASGGGVSGGAVVFDPLVANDLYSDRDVQRVSPGGEFPIITTSRRAPNVAVVEKWGGKVFITDEARDRNNTIMFTNSIRQLANTIVRKINQRAVEQLDAAVTANSRTLTGHSWSTVVVGGSSQSAANLWPARDFGAVQVQAEQEELGVVYDLWIINPLEFLSLSTVYGAFLSDILNSAGIDIYVTNRVAAGTAYAVASKQVGEMRIEKPLGTETWREEKTERTWVQSSVRPLFLVDNPFAVIKVSGLA